MRITYKDLYFSDEVEFVEEKEFGRTYITIDEVIIEDNKIVAIFLPYNNIIAEEYFITAARRKWDIDDIVVHYSLPRTDFNKLADMYKQLTISELAKIFR